MDGAHVGVVVHSLSHNNIGRVYPFLRAMEGVPGLRCTLVGWDDGGGLFPLLDGLPWPVVRLAGPASGPAAERALAEALAGCDLVHCFKNQAHFAAAAAVARARGLPLVLDLDDWELGLYLEGVARWPAWRRALWGLPVTRRVAAALELEQLARTAPDALVVNSRALQAHFGGQIIYTAADERAFDPAQANGAAFRARVGLAADAPTIGFPGTPHPHKGIDDLLEAFASVRVAIPQARLLFVGVPAHNPYRARLAATPGVVCTGYLAAHEYPSAYAACDVVAIPQRAVTEGVMQMPAKLILAMAAARPIVATSVGDLPLALGDAGRCVPPQQPRAMACALTELLEDAAQRDRLGAAARERFFACFSLGHVREAMLGVYGQLLGVGR